MNMMKNPVHPGQIVKHDCIETLGLTVTDAATALREEIDGDLMGTGIGLNELLEQLLRRLEEVERAAEVATRQADAAAEEARTKAREAGTATALVAEVKGLIRMVEAELQRKTRDVLNGEVAATTS